PFAQLGGNCCFEFDRPRAKRRAGYRDPAAHDGAQVDVRTHAAKRRDDDNAAIVRDAFELARQVITGHHIEDHVDAASAGEIFDHRGEVLALVVDAACGTELLACAALLIVARGCVHLVSHRRCKLDGSDADPAASTLYEQAFARGKTRAIEDV